MRFILALLLLISGATYADGPYTRSRVIGSSGGGGASATPGGVSGSVQFNANGAFGGNAGLTYSGTSLSVSATTTRGYVSTTANTSTTVVNWSTAENYFLTITTPTTISFTGFPASTLQQYLRLTMVMPSPSVVVTLPSALWSYGVSPTFNVSTTGLSRHDLLFSTMNGGGTVSGYYPGQFMQ